MQVTSPILKHGIFCGGGCDRVLADDHFFTEVNPPGGFGREQLLVCDDCMRSGEWDYWKSEHWPNWPEPRVFDAQDRE